jgi:hypothetical protein
MPFALFGWHQLDSMPLCWFQAQLEAMQLVSPESMHRPLIAGLCQFKLLFDLREGLF